MEFVGLFCELCIWALGLEDSITVSISLRPTLDWPYLESLSGERTLDISFTPKFFVRIYLEVYSLVVMHPHQQLKLYESRKTKA